jgi:hypothetical protein
MFADYRQSQVGAPVGDQQELENFAENNEKQQNTETLSVFTKVALLQFLDHSYKELAYAESFAKAQQKVELVETIKRARKRLRGIAEDLESNEQINDQALEHDLDAIDRMILKSIRESLDETQKQAIEDEAEAHLKAYKRKMDKKIFEQTWQNFISRRLRETHKIPRMSLFYI